MSTLAERVAVVTGGSRGIGRAIAEGLAGRGATVVVNYVQNHDAAQETVAGIRGAGGRADLSRFDVSDGQATHDAVRQIVDRHGRVDILVNNAGVSVNALLPRLKEADWGRVLATNLTGVFHCTQAVLRTMLRSRYGRIVNLTSVVAELGNAGQTAYGAAKAGVTGMTRSLAREVAGRGITVNCVAPGFIETEMTAELPQTVRDEYLRLIPMGRLGEAEDVATLVAFLCAPDAGYITGQEIGVNGGMCM